jgi:hypothetical protein
MSVIRIKGWHPEKSWASTTIPRRTLFKRIECVSPLRATELKRLVERICHRESLDIPVRDGIKEYSLISFLEGYGAESEAISAQGSPINPLG